MSRLRLLVRTLAHFRLTDLAAALAVAVGTAALAGSLIVGESVGRSLAGIVERRLGDVDHVLVAPRFFPEDLAERLRASPGFAARFERVEPLVMTAGSCVCPRSGAVAAGVNVFGRGTVAGGTCVVSTALARHLAAGPGETVVLRMDLRESVSAGLPVGAHRSDVGVLRLVVERVAEEAGFEDAFSLYGSQRPPRNAWVCAADLAAALGVPRRANALAVSERRDRPVTQALDGLLRDVVTLDDYGLSLRTAPDGALVLESDQLLLPPAVEEAAGRLRARQSGAFASTGVFAYIATTIRDARNGREIPYSMVAGIGEGAMPDGRQVGGRQAIVLSRWAADDLGAQPGDGLELRFPVRAESGLLEERAASFTLERVVDTEAISADGTLVPEFKGITDADTLATWDPPRDFDFRIERIRPTDEDYWRRYRTAPKALVGIAEAQRLWGSGLGRLTSLRFTRGMYAPAELESALIEALEPASAGLVWRPIRAEQLAAASGGTDFGGLFAGLSSFLVLSSALLVALVMLLAVEQRRRQVGVMLATGFTTNDVRRIFLAEGGLVLLAGCAVGAAASVGYAWLMLAGLRTVWNDAVGTRLLALHVSAGSLAGGFGGGVAIGGIAIWMGLARVRAMRIVEALGCSHSADARPHPGDAPDAGSDAGAVVTASSLAIAALVVAAGALVATAALSEAIDTTLAFFGSGACILAAFLTGLRAWLRGLSRSRAGSRRGPSPAGLGVRNASRNPSRSMLSAGLIASASFVTMAVGAMRFEASSGAPDRSTGLGGYSLVADFDVPVPYDISTPKGRELLAIHEDAMPDLSAAAQAGGRQAGGAWRRARLATMRTSAGGDVSCLNLYRPASPRVASVPASFGAERRFSFVSAAGEAGSPWSLLETDGDPIPAIADYETARWTMHKGLGETVQVTDEHGARRDLVIVAFLRKSIFQGELLVSERSFRRLFPSRSGCSRVLVEASERDSGVIRRILAHDLADFGATVESTAERAASFAGVANAYIAAFEALGGLGLLLGSFGLVAILLRGVLERRAELALMHALGFRRRSIALAVAAENVFLLAVGVMAGTAAAALAIAPEFVRSGGGVRPAALTAAGFAGIVVLMTLTLAVVSVVMARKVSPASLMSE